MSMTKVSSIRYPKTGPKGRQRGKTTDVVRFTIRCDFCVAKNRFGNVPTIEWDPFAEPLHHTVSIPVFEGTELDGWYYIPKSDFTNTPESADDRNWMPSEEKHVCSLCMAQHFPEDDR